MRVGIVTLFYKNYNYGGILQAYALQKTIEKIGYEASVISYDRFKLAKRYTQTPIQEKKTIIEKVKGKIERKKRIEREKKISGTIEDKKRSFDDFINTYMDYTADSFDCESIANTTQIFDCYVTGSDQVWSPISSTHGTFLDFVPDEVPKLSYAASIGADHVTEDFVEYMKPLINRFHSLSVREESAKKIISPLTDKTCHVSLDPTFLITADEWKCIKKENKYSKKDYLLVYLIGYSSEHRKIAKKIAKKNNLELVFIPYNKMKYNQGDAMLKASFAQGIGPREFLDLVANAKYFVTDSFHGTVFALLNHTPFSVLNRESENGSATMHTRITNLLGATKMDHRICHNYNEVVDNYQEELSFDMADSFIEMKRRESKEYLKRTLEEAEDMVIDKTYRRA